MRKLKRSECAVLPLVVKGKWYDMIERGEKKEEYRDAKAYWDVRLRNWNTRVSESVLPVVEFRRGYRKNAPRIAFWCFGMCTAVGIKAFALEFNARYPGWGEPQTPHFVIRLGGMVELDG